LQSDYLPLYTFLTESHFCPDLDDLIATARTIVNERTMKEGNRISPTSPIGVIPGIDDMVGNDSSASPSQLLKKKCVCLYLGRFSKFSKRLSWHVQCI